MGAQDQASGAPEHTAPDLAATVAKLVELLEQIAHHEPGVPEWARTMMARLDTLGGEPGIPGKNAPPRSLWPWVVTELTSEVGWFHVAKAVGVTVEQLQSWARGHSTPSSKHRDELRALLASLWARELDLGGDELEQMRERVMGRPNGAHT